MKIVKGDGLLSDGFTRCVQVEIAGSVFFLLKDQDTHLAHSGNPGYERTFDNVTAIGDTIQILNGRSLAFSSVNALRRRPLHPGDKCIRVFLRGNNAYCQTLDGIPEYGWIDFSAGREGKDWKVYRSPLMANAVIPDNVVQKIRTRINDVNEVFMKLYQHFNRQTHQQKEAPRWNLAVSGDSVVCVLEGPGNPDDFQQSTTYLAKDIDNLTLGANLSVMQAPGRIEVTTRGEHESQAR